MTLSLRNIKTAWIALVTFYIPLCYFALYQEWGLDFASYYASSFSMVHGEIPYLPGMTTHDHFLRDWVLPGNPNPPFTLAVFSIFSYFNYPIAFGLWLTVSTWLGAVGAYKTIQIVCPKLFEEKEVSVFLLIYFAGYPIMMNTVMLQLGGCLLFLLIMGYEAYLQRKERWAGFWWGSLIALKLFPVLLVGYALLKKRFQLAGWLILWALLLTLSPLLFLEKSLYWHYSEAITHKIFWYGVNWNMSILGFLFREFVPMVNDPVTKAYTPLNDVFFIQCLFIEMAVTMLAVWVYFFKSLETPAHRDFSCVILLMMLLSPFGWLYYLPMLLIPIICTLNDVLTPSNTLEVSSVTAKSRAFRLTLWFITLFCFYFPIPVVHVIAMTDWKSKMGVYSIQFYGLLLLSYLTVTLRSSPENLSIKKMPEGVKQGIVAITGFSLLFIVIRCSIFLLRYRFGVGG